MGLHLILFVWTIPIRTQIFTLLSERERFLPKSAGLIVILGAQGVGKTSLTEQFVYNHFCTDQKPTRKRKIYYPSIIINDHLYKV